MVHAIFLSAATESIPSTPDGWPRTQSLCAHLVRCGEAPALDGNAAGRYRLVAAHGKSTLSSKQMMYNQLLPVTIKLGAAKNTHVRECPDLFFKYMFKHMSITRNLFIQMCIY